MEKRESWRKRRTKAGAILIAAMLLLGACRVENGSSGEAEYGDAVEPEKSIVLIKAGEAAGSGVLMGSSADGERLMLLTAAHVLEYLADGELPTVIFADGTERSCDGYECSASMDAAVLYLADAALVKQLEKENCFAREDRLRFDNLKDGDDCIAIGCGDGGGKSVCTGEILDNWIYMEDYGQYMLWADVEIRPGMSGGGLFDSEGYFLGILSGGSEDGQLAAVPLSLILSEFHNSLD